MSFENLKRNRSSSIEALTKAAESVKGGGSKESYADDRFWKPAVDKSGNGYAVIRFLPAPVGEELPWIRFWDHGFQGPGGLWYIENSLTSINQQDPVSEMNTVLWNSGRDTDKAIARDRKRRLHYVANIIVVEDPTNPDNNGKIKLYKFGKKIFDKIMDVMQPEFADEDPVNPFDFWEGADFKIKIRKVEGWTNYDKSEFSKVKAVSTDDAKLESIYNDLNSLQEFLEPKNYKTYDELKNRLNKVLGDTGRVMTTAESISVDTSDNRPAVRSSYSDKEESSSNKDVDDSDNDTLSYFQKLAAQG